jgi:hypothetical protein
MYILGCNDRIGQIRREVFLGQHLMGKIQVILIDKASIKALPLLVEIIVAVKRVR